MSEHRTVCAVCGEKVEGAVDGEQPYPANGDWVHRGGADGCFARYWDPPGEWLLTDESW